jgi:hypothetical protein
MQFMGAIDMSQLQEGDMVRVNCTECPFIDGSMCEIALLLTTEVVVEHFGSWFVVPYTDIKKPKRKGSQWE